MADNRIKHTKNYKLFHRSDDNRELAVERRRPLLQSMKQYGWLSCFPAVCKMNEKGEIVIKDGQHRFAIAETLGLEVYYILEEVDFDISVVNSAQKTWTVQDYAHRFAIQGNEHYIEALEFSEKHSLPLGMSFGLLYGSTTWSNALPLLRTGKFVVRDRAYANMVVSIYVPFIKASAAINNSRFLEACCRVCRVPDFSCDRLIQGMERCRDKLVDYSTFDSYLDMLEEIYNFGRKHLVPLKIEAKNAMRARSVANVNQHKNEDKD